VAPPEVRPPIQAAPVTPRRVLVVDDNVDAARTLADLLVLEGHEAHVAHDGPSAVEAALRLRPDVAFLDIGSPASAARGGRAPSGGAVPRGPLPRGPCPDGCSRRTSAVPGRRARRHLAKPVDLATIERLLALADATARTT